MVLLIHETCKLDLHAWYLDDGTIAGDTFEVAKALDIVIRDGPRRGLFINIGKTEIFWPHVDKRSFDEGLFPRHIARPSSGVKLLGGPVSTCPNFCSELVLHRARKATALMSIVRCLDDPQCELLLLRNCIGVARLQFALRTCPPHFLQEAIFEFDKELRCSVDHIITANGQGLGEWQWRQVTLPFRLGGFGIYTAADTAGYAFVASRVQTRHLQNQILRCYEKSELLVNGECFDNAATDYGKRCYAELPCIEEGTAPTNYMAKMAVTFFNAIERTLVEDYKPTEREMQVRLCTKASHAADFFHAIPIAGLHQKMQARMYRSILQYRLAIPIFRGHPRCPSCELEKMDLWGDHALHCSNAIGTKQRHNLVRDVLVDMCIKGGIYVQKEAHVGMFDSEGREMRPGDLLVYGWINGKDTCVDVVGTSPFTNNNFTPYTAIQHAIDRKKKKYLDLCTAKGYGFLAFAFTTFGELGLDAIDFLNRIKRVTKTHEHGAKNSEFIFQRLGFVIQKGVGAQLVTRLPTNFV